MKIFKPPWVAEEFPEITAIRLESGNPRIAEEFMIAYKINKEKLDIAIEALKHYRGVYVWEVNNHRDYASAALESIGEDEK